MKTYFVEYRLYNGDNNGWAYKTELRTDDYALAIQKYGECMKTYYGKAPFAFGYICVEDEKGNRYQQITWGEVPTPTVEEVVEE